MKGSRKQAYLQGIRHGIPICLGYFAVALSLGISAAAAGLTPAQATLNSFLIHASAGEFVGITMIATGAGYLEAVVMEAIANARYLLMSCALSQKLSPRTGILQRLLVGFGVTDEIFGISVAYPGDLNPYYSFGAISVALPGWACGTLLGTVLGGILPTRAVSALSVALYGMFVAIIIPPARKSRIVAILIAVSFALSALASWLPILSGISSGIKTIVLTVSISLVAAILFPVKEEADDA